MQKYLRFVFPAVLFLGLAFCGSASAGRVYNYVYFCADREQISNPAFLETAAFEGAHIMYWWKKLEPEKDSYDFSEIREDLKFLQSKGKKLFIQLQDSTFSEDRIFVPKYLLQDPAYHGGANRQYDDHDKPAGWVSRRWDPAVRERFQKLMAALGKEFDGKIEGINLPETAFDLGEPIPMIPPGFTYTAYRDGILANMKALKKAFPKSVTIQYANFMPGEWLPDNDRSLLRSVYQYAKRVGVGVGGPDLLPHKRPQMNHAYKFIRESNGAVPVLIAVQDGNYSHVDPETSRQVTVQELAAFAKDYLKADYVSWCMEEPFFSRDVIPYFKSINAGVTHR